MFLTRCIRSITNRSHHQHLTVSRRRKSDVKPRLDSLEDRLAPDASVVIAESTFDPEAFGQNMSAALDYNTVGYAYAVNHDGDAVVAEGTGGLYGPNAGRARTSLDQPETVFETDTRIEQNSVSKIITTVAVLHLLESQGDDLDAMLSTPIAEFLPSSWTIGPNVDLITVRHLLSHTSGFVEDSSNAIGVNFEDYSENNFQNLRDLVEEGLEDPPTMTLPDGSIVPAITLPDGSMGYPRSYSNSNFSLLAKMIPYMLPGMRGFLDLALFAHPAQADVILGAVYGAYVADNILTPCGINNPTMDVTGENPALGYDFATVDSVAGTHQHDYSALGGAFGWKLSALELAQFMNTLRHTNILLSDTAKDLMNNNTFVLGWLPNGSVSGSNPYVLAPKLDAFGTYYTHDGAGNNFRSQILMFPGDIEASLVMNSFPPGIPDRFALMRTAYHDAWSSLVIEGDVSGNEFLVRRNTDDANRIDISMDGILIASPSEDLLTSLELRGLGGNDTFRIDDLPAGVDLILKGGDNDDLFKIGAGDLDSNVLGDIAIRGGAGNDTIRLDDIDDNLGNDSYFLSGNTFSKPFTQSWSYIQTENVTLITSDFDNTVHVSGLALANLTINGSAGDDTIELGTGRADIIQADIHVNGGEDHDVIHINNQDAPGSRTYTFDGETFDMTGAFFEALSYTSIEGLALVAGTSSDTINVPSSDLSTVIEVFANAGTDSFNVATGQIAAIGNALVLHGGDGADVAFVNDQDDLGSDEYQVTANQVSKPAFLLLYDGLEGVTLNAGAGDNTINIHDTLPGTSLVVNAGVGNDQIHLSPVAMNLGQVRGLVTAHGQDGSDTVFAHDEAFALGAKYGLGHVKLGRPGFGGLIFDTIDRLELHMGSGNDTVNVSDFNRDVLFALYGNDGADTFNITIVPSAVNTGGNLFIDGGADSDQINVVYVTKPVVPHKPKVHHTQVPMLDDGTITVDYEDLGALFQIDYQKVETVEIDKL